MTEHLTDPLSQLKQDTVQKAFEFRKQQFFKDLERAKQEGSSSLVVVKGEQFKHTRMNEVGAIDPLSRWIDWYIFFSGNLCQSICPSASELLGETKLLFEWLQEENYKPVIERVASSQEYGFGMVVYNTWGIVVRWN